MTGLEPFRELATLDSNCCFHVSAPVCVSAIPLGTAQVALRSYVYKGFKSADGSPGDDGSYFTDPDPIPRIDWVTWGCAH